MIPVGTPIVGVRHKKASGREKKTAGRGAKTGRNCSRFDQKGCAARFFVFCAVTAKIVLPASSPRRPRPRRWKGSTRTRPTLTTAGSAGAIDYQKNCPDRRDREKDQVAGDQDQPSGNPGQDPHRREVMPSRQLWPAGPGHRAVLPRQQILPPPCRAVLSSPRRNGTLSGMSEPLEPNPARSHRLRVPGIVGPIRKTGARVIARISLQHNTDSRYLSGVSCTTGPRTPVL